MTKPDAAIIIPHYNDQERLNRCMAALQPQIDDGIDAIVVDNASDTPPEVMPPFRLVVEEKKGAAHARNRGVEETTANRFFFIDSDCLPDDDWVEVARRVAARADLVGGHVYVFDETPPPRSGAEAFETVFAFDFKSYIEKQGFSGSGNLVTHRGVFDKIGGFRAGVSEDYDWSHRATAAGYTLVYESALRVGHPSRRDWAALRRKWHRVTQEAFGLNGPGLAARARWFGRALMMPVSVVIHAPRIIRADSLAPDERKAALVTLARQRLVRMRWMVLQALGFKI
ncbi:glycosyltransferase family 2 protein [Vannielia litorea]|uniref:glycosyltransferase family 2 protein n=1 Tax=Vannielia litorea TaxID=1217970 RepID=UPI001C96A01C|nr:glycosyltransferase family A protein [Vannielia litorea]MBY6049532.1 glycosyltransferase family 2 protein [Vannielia litorea]MBY6076946.1 glycosyltransferase family 2 protein [Vannielia litorea]